MKLHIENTRETLLPAEGSGRNRPAFANGKALIWDYKGIHRSISTVSIDPETGLLKVKATVERAGGQLVVWTPTADDAAHPINVAGLTDVVATDVPGGRLVTATVEAAGTYALWVGEPDEDLTPSTTTTTTTTPGGAGPASPVAGSPSYTG